MGGFWRSVCLCSDDGESSVNRPFISLLSLLLLLWLWLLLWLLCLLARVNTVSASGVNRILALHSISRLSESSHRVEMTD